MTRINSAQDPGRKPGLSNRLAIGQTTVRANMQAVQACKEISEPSQEARRERKCMQFDETAC
ncbi:MAG: hypothetical protein LBE22_00660 [Azoarcus sp.]|nr:hypothetical protein [Azoarcus sp.]